MMDEIYKRFFDNLRKIRIAKGFSAKALSQACELKQLKRISDFEDGRGVPSTEEILTICRYLNVNVDDMLYKEAHATITFKENNDNSGNNSTVNNNRITIRE